MNPIITGISIWTAAGWGFEPLLARLQENDPAFSPFPPYPAEGLTCPKSAWITDLPRQRPAESLLLRVVKEVLEQSQIGSLKRTGLVVGTSTGNVSGPWEQWHKNFLEGNESSEDGCGRDGPANFVAEKLGFGGPVMTLSAACASGTAAFIIAKSWLDDDLVDSVVVAGVDALSLFIHAGFNGLGALSPTGAKSFHATRDGLTPGEGAGAIVLERKGGNLKEAFAELVGLGAASDAFHISAPHREGIGAAKAMIQAIHGLDKIDMLSLHGTSTIYNDLMEGHAVRRVFSENIPPFHGIKHIIGHTMGAAGAIEAAFVVWCLKNGVQPPPPEEIDPAIPLPKIDSAPKPTIALSTSSAFGGTNASVVFALPDLVNKSKPTKKKVLERAFSGIIKLPDGKVEWKDLWLNPGERFKRLSRYVRLGLLAIKKLEQDFSSETGIVLASPTGCRSIDLRYHSRLLKRGASQASRLDFIYTIPGGPAAEASIMWNLQGPIFPIVGSLGTAHKEARRLIEYGFFHSLIALEIDVPDSEGASVAYASLLETDEF